MIIDGIVRNNISFLNNEINLTTKKHLKISNFYIKIIILR